MGIVVVVVIVVLVIGAGLWIMGRTSRRATPVAEPERPRPVISDATPMTGLEFALDQATDRTGRNMREKIEGGTGIDELRVPDDTGPILRRALDQVEQPGPKPEPELNPVEPVAPTAETGEG